jgi:nucleoside 2-deoxyribosyltransferase
MTKFDVSTTEEVSRQLTEVCNRAKEYAEGGVRLAYLASPWFDNNALALHNAVATIDSILGDRNNYKIYYPKNHNEATPEDTFNSNVSALNACDIVIALISRKDVGTAWEIGYAYALGKKIYLVTYDEDCFRSKTNLMLAYTGKCFTIDKLAKFLTSDLDSVDYIHIDRLWEDVE